MMASRRLCHKAGRSLLPLPCFRMQVKGPAASSHRAALPAHCRALSSAAGGTKVVSLGIVGYGLVGKELAAQVAAQRAALQSKGVDLQIVAVARSKQMRLTGPGADAQSGGDEATDLKKFSAYVASSPGCRIIVDCTADDTPAQHYADWLAGGVSVVTPNKKFGSGPLARFEKARESAKAAGSCYFGEATVGAGLPVITTLQDLVNTGDKIESIEGIFSGTLSFLFNRLGADTPFSQVLQEASALGFTEPDPRDDLSGTDVQRKVVILAREAGLRLELADVPVESLVPATLQSWQPSEAECAGPNGLLKSFMKKLELENFDATMAQKISEAVAKEEVLRYVGSIDVLNGKASVSLRSFPRSHAFAATQHADNVMTFATERYKPRPLVVQGPGAGAAVTAGGIFADILRAAVAS
eukprot:gnl/TRDRNA2_/TRDRNA2_166294_c0_seq1.p1 gnl/TRDRNA2_/TRDRNA2_166294_c0~~gnl/TRDRNA2_/TRDRNA2_166294_c0_seq1.p1  ORF type:complete len:413 (-),score=89.89 gnl/TRDRNA2_/TRDRNA2_166294_c0_seq1:112-1350(-)